MYFEWELWTPSFLASIKTTVIHEKSIWWAKGALVLSFTSTVWRRLCINHLLPAGQKDAGSNTNTHSHTRQKQTEGDVTTHEQTSPRTHSIFTLRKKVKSENPHPKCLEHLCHSVAEINPKTSFWRKIRNKFFKKEHMIKMMLAGACKKPFEAATD